MRNSTRSVTRRAGLSEVREKERERERIVGGGGQPPLEVYDHARDKYPNYSYGIVRPRSVRRLNDDDDGTPSISLHRPPSYFPFFD